MPSKVVDLSARSRHIREEPWHLHFWEATPREALAYLRDPRGFLEDLGIHLPAETRIETVITNHDWLSSAAGLADQEEAADNGPIVICNVGGGDVAIAFYRVTMYAHHVDDVGRFEKTLLHAPEAEEMELGAS
jgi:hypothetical protein